MPRVREGLLFLFCTATLPACLASYSSMGSYTSLARPGTVPVSVAYQGFSIDRTDVAIDTCGIDNTEENYRRIAQPVVEKFNTAFRRDLVERKVFAEVVDEKASAQLVLTGKIERLSINSRYCHYLGLVPIFGNASVIFGVPVCCGRGEIRVAVTLRTREGQEVEKFVAEKGVSRCAGLYYNWSAEPVSEAFAAVAEVLKQKIVERSAPIVAAAGGPVEKPVAPGAVAAATPHRKLRVVAVFDVEDPSSRFPAKTIDQLTEYLATQLTVQGMRTVPRNQLRQRLATEKTGSYKQCFDSACQIELGKAVAAAKTLSTKLLQVGNRCAITSILFDLKTETTERAASASTDCSVDALMGGVDNIARQLVPKR